jgi:hypothetical protein
MNGVDFLIPDSREERSGFGSNTLTRFIWFHSTGTTFVGVLGRAGVLL